MPLYEYRCESCGHTFEKIQKFSDPPEATCQKCGGSVRKLLSSPAFHFKGSGWYITDYAKKSSDGGSTAKKEDGSSSADKGDTTAPSTPAASGDSAKKD